MPTTTAPPKPTPTKSKFAPPTPNGGVNPNPQRGRPPQPPKGASTPTPLSALSPERRKIGRPKQREIKEVRQTALFTPSEWESVETVMPEGRQPGPWLREVALEHAKVGRNAVLVDKAMMGTENVRARFLTKAPCGPWAEAIEHAGDFVLSADIADELQVRPHDVLVRAVGESMEGAGILDGALVVMRPLPEHRVPRNGEIALVEVTVEDGDTFGTIKHWHSGGLGQPPRLTDGQGQDFPLPEGVTNVRPVAVADGVIARL